MQASIASDALRRLGHVGGKRSVLLSVLKNGTVSTLKIASSIRAMLPSTLAKLPKDLRATLLFDQSLFVRAAVDGVVKEAAIAAALTGLMILVFLGSWRSTLIVVISIPLSILVSITVLAVMGHTLNVMTLGGMALAVRDAERVRLEAVGARLRERHGGIHAAREQHDGTRSAHACATCHASTPQNPQTGRQLATYTRKRCITRL